MSFHVLARSLEADLRAAGEREWADRVADARLVSLSPSEIVGSLLLCTKALTRDGSMPSALRQQAAALHDVLDRAWNAR